MRRRLLGFFPFPSKSESIHEKIKANIIFLPSEKDGQIWDTPK